ncbi:ATP-binding protein [Hymenobacter metallicola]|uniref:ATP-binding protein n=1 Tax=Hymenobacter metallicola TaxID=2563114 RepID=A0A4Z0QH88_9BACT|nr:ATP-binding protein [Hymenobacter metallicola]TGE28613.1 ATP-binding protein [Hymenobacter metallicola]
MQLIVFCGMQATGKSTFYQQHFFHSHVRISLDLLRTRNRERRLLALCLETQMRCVVDNTNPTRAERAQYIGPARQAGFAVTGYYFHSTAAEAFARNVQRPAERQVPEVGIRATRNRLEIPRFAEGFDALYSVRPTANHTFDISPWQDEI